MIYRYREDEKILITIIGIEKYGISVCRKLRDLLLRCFNANSNDSANIFTDSNGLSEICYLSFEKKMSDNTGKVIPFNGRDIESEARTRNMLLIIGDTAAPGFEKLYESALCLLGKTGCKKIAFIKGRAVASAADDIRPDHVIICDKKSSVTGMIIELLKMTYFPKFAVSTFEPEEFRHLFGACGGEMLMASRLIRLQAAVSEDEYFDAIGSLVSDTTESLLKQADSSREYTAFVCVKGRNSLKMMAMIMDRFCGTAANLKMDDAKLCIMETGEGSGESGGSCMVFLIEAEAYRQDSSYLLSLLT